MAAHTLLADKAFDADKRVIKPLLAAGKTAVIPAKRNRKSSAITTKSLQGPPSHRELLRKLKQFRAIATRYDKTARNFLAAIQLVAAIIWLN